MSDIQAKEWISLAIISTGVVILGSVGMWEAVAGISLWTIGGFMLKDRYRD